MKFLIGLQIFYDIYFISVLTLIWSNWIVVLWSLLGSLFYAKPKTRWEANDDLERWLMQTNIFQALSMCVSVWSNFYIATCPWPHQETQYLKILWMSDYIFQLQTSFLYIFVDFICISLWTFFSSLQFRITH